MGKITGETPEVRSDKRKTREKKEKKREEERKKGEEERKREKNKRKREKKKKARKREKREKRERKESKRGKKREKRSLAGYCSTPDSLVDRFVPTASLGGGKSSAEKCKEGNGGCTPSKRPGCKPTAS